ncbi:hypothetical protein KR032_009292, partial [Drosophila birchii]
LNLNHCRAAQDLLRQTVRELGSEVAILSEPYRTGSGRGWVTDSTGRAALWLCGAEAPEMREVRATEGLVRANVGGIWLYSCYLAPNDGVQLLSSSFRDIVLEIAQDARGRSPVLIAGDFNAWTTEWESTIDLTFASPELSRNTSWRVSGLYTHSDHAAITMEIRADQPSPQNRQMAYKAGTLNTDALLANMDAITTAGDANTCVEGLSAKIKAACDAAMVRCCRGNGRRPVPWWNQEIDAARRQCLSARRRCQRSSGRPAHEQYEASFRERKRPLKV